MHSYTPIEDPVERADALRRFLLRKAEIDHLLARLDHLSEDHFGVLEEDISWDDLDEVDVLAGKLREAVVHLCGEDLPADA